MKLRCDLHVNGTNRKLILVAGPNEKPDHLGLKLAACVLFWEYAPIVAASASHPALLDQEFVPDLLGVDEAGQAKLWVECGSATLHKLAKLTRRFPHARLVVLKAAEREAARLRKDMQDQFEKHEKIEVLSWPDGLFQEWMSAIEEKTEVYGEGGGLSLNLVINERPFAVDLKSF